MPSSAEPVSTLPVHVAVIMDGNGRWARARGLSRTEGHKKGAEAAQKVVENARDLGIKYLTLFTFSSENWQRPVEEVGELMGLLRFYLKKETAELHKSNARLRVIGERDRLAADIVKMIEQAEDLTKNNTGITVVIALSYGGRQDITQAVRNIAKAAKRGDIDAASIDDAMISKFLLTDGIPDPDLVIRTSGEARISNFLLWQMAYAELFFTNTLWPDFSKSDLEEGLAFYAGRERRFGGLIEKSAVKK